MAPAPHRVLSLLVLATIANLPAVGGVRSVMSDFGEQDASAEAAEAVATWSVTDEHLKIICTEQLEVQTCEALGASPGGEHPFASRRDLAETLSITEDQARSLLSHVGLEPVGENGNFGCKEFCRAAVRKIPTMLHAAVPLNPGVACVDASCATKLVQVSESVLATANLKSGVGKVHDSLVKVDRPTWDATASPLSDAELLRLAVNIILGIFPSIEDGVEEGEGADIGGAALVEQQQQRRGSEEPISVSWDANLEKEQHALLKACQAKAVAWVATAIRKYRPGHALARKWFRLDRPEMAGKEKYAAAVEEFVRWHMQKMLTGLYKLYLMRNACNDNVLAFTQVKSECDVDTVLKSDAPCGEMSSSRHYVIRLCDLYFEQDESRRVGTLVHEISHHFGTNDYGYDEKALTLNTESARDNADSYMRFIQELVKSKEAEDVFGTPHASCNTICDPLMFEKLEMINRLPLNTCGKCVMKSNPNTPLVGKLFGEGCGKGDIEVANTTFKHVCCTPYPCTKPAPATSG